MRDKCRQRACAVKKDKWGDDRGWDTQGKDSDADKSMRCFNKRVCVCTALQIPDNKTKCFLFQKPLAAYGWMDTNSIVAFKENLTSALLWNESCVCFHFLQRAQILSLRHPSSFRQLN